MQTDYIVQCMKRMQKEGIKALEVKPEPIEELYEHIGKSYQRHATINSVKMLTPGRRISSPFGLER